ncbi:MAG: SOS response-associated peptidase [Deltaproteobacteria bacterium]|nr:SOS response-associated peptidase [Deltaproteobacteria bacterium]
MCGRFVGFRNLEQLRNFFPIDRAMCKVTASYNVAPSQEILAIVCREGENRLEKFHWGLVPFWAKDTSMGKRLVNARAETIASKPSFRNAFKKRRCLIIADGFYEWRSMNHGKQPVFITLPDKHPFAFAGLWEAWNKKDNSDPAYHSCTIITIEASVAIRQIHHRMPAVLKTDVYETWLDPKNQDVHALQSILKNDVITEFSSYPVSNSVNSVRNNDPSNIEPFTQMQLDF